MFFDYEIKECASANESINNFPAEDTSFCKNDVTIYGNEPHQAFVWTEADRNISKILSETGGFSSNRELSHTEILNEFVDEEKDDVSSTSTRTVQPFCKQGISIDTVTSTSKANLKNKHLKVSKSDPRSRLHYIKYLNLENKTIKLWECGICGREFQHQYTLMRHLPTHTDERNYHCQECGKSFRQLSTLSQHKAIHSSARPYSCEVCSKTFNRVSTLISHRKTHSNNKPYKCHVCPKGFHQKGNLRNHLFTHTNERPYRCSICFKGFNQQSNLVCHKIKAHGEVAAPVNNSRLPRILRPRSQGLKEVKSKVNCCEVSSSNLPATSKEENKIKNQEVIIDITDNANVKNNGAVVDAIKNVQMNVAAKQTPFALFKIESGSPFLVKVYDAQTHNGKQTLLQAVDELKNEDITFNDNKSLIQNKNLKAEDSLRVPFVATVVPKIKSSKNQDLVVEDPLGGYHTTLDAKPSTSATIDLKKFEYPEVEILSSSPLALTSSNRKLPSSCWNPDTMSLDFTVLDNLDNLDFNSSESQSIEDDEIIQLNEDSFVIETLGINSKKTEQNFQRFSPIDRGDFKESFCIYCADQVAGEAISLSDSE